MNIVNNVTLSRPTVGSVVILLILFVGCELASMYEEEEGLSTDQEKAILELRLHDRPVEYDEVIIDVKQVKIKKDENGNEPDPETELEGNGSEEGENKENGEEKGNDEDKDKGEDEETDGSPDPDDTWIILNEPDKRYNILELVNGRFEVLGVQELEAGKYSQLRLVLGEENSITVNGKTRELKTPGALQSGLKLDIDLELNVGDHVVLQIDFDAAESILAIGPPWAPFQYLLKPVLRSSLLTDTGNIAGSILQPDVRAVVYAIDENHRKKAASTFTDWETGEFKLIGLPEGFYSLNIEPGGEEPVNKRVENIEVIQGETTNTGAIDLRAE